MSAKLRFEIFKRDRFRCVYCGRTPPEVMLELDHVHPRSAGGPASELNLVTACFECNRGKGARLLDAVPHGHEATIIERRERLEQLRAMNRLIDEEEEEQEIMFYRVSILWMTLSGEDSDKLILGGQTASSVRRFLKLLPFDEVCDAVRVMHEKVGWKAAWDKHKFFCGVCWRKIEQRKASQCGHGAEAQEDAP